MTLTLTIDLARKCAECGKDGATGSGLCLGCGTKAMRGKKMTSETGKAVQWRWKCGLTRDGRSLKNHE